MGELMSVSEATALVVKYMPAAREELRRAGLAEKAWTDADQVAAQLVADLEDSEDAAAVLGRLRGGGEDGDTAAVGLVAGAMAAAFTRLHVRRGSAA